MLSPEDRSAPEIVHDLPARRFEAVTEGKRSILTYMQSEGKLVLVHTEVPADLQGHGIGNKLASAAFDYARVQGLQVIPKCPFIATFLEHYPEYRNLVVQE